MDNIYAADIQRMDIDELMRLAEVEETVARWQSLRDEQFRLPLLTPLGRSMPFRRQARS